MTKKKTKSLETSIISIGVTPIYMNTDYKLDKKTKDKIIKVVELFNHVNHGGNTTSNNSQVLELPYMAKLKEHILKHINTYVYEILCIQKELEFYIVTSWLNINKKNTAHHMHHHANSFISGTYYLQGDTPIFFNQTPVWMQNFEFEHTDYNVYNSLTTRVRVKEGMCLLFPSTLTHGVDRNMSDTPRISLSFNVFFRGKLGSENKATILPLK